MHLTREQFLALMAEAECTPRTVRTFLREGVLRRETLRTLQAAAERLGIGTPETYRGSPRVWPELEARPLPRTRPACLPHFDHAPAPDAPRMSELIRRRDAARVSE